MHMPADSTKKPERLPGPYQNSGFSSSNSQHNTKPKRDPKLSFSHRGYAFPETSTPLNFHFKTTAGLEAEAWMKRGNPRLGPDSATGTGCSILQSRVPPLQNGYRNSYFTRKAPLRPCLRMLASSLCHNRQGTFLFPHPLMQSRGSVPGVTWRVTSRGRLCRALDHFPFPENAAREKAFKRLQMPQPTPHP